MTRYVCVTCGSSGNDPLPDNRRYKCHVCPEPSIMLEAINKDILQDELDNPNLVLFTSSYDAPQRPDLESGVS